jgi:hypothetical protein
VLSVVGRQNATDYLGGSINRDPLAVRVRRFQTWHRYSCFPDCRAWKIETRKVFRLLVRGLRCTMAVDVWKFCN